MTYNMHPTYAAHALRMMLAGKRVLVLVDRARERRDTLTDIMNTAHEIGLTDADNGLDLVARFAAGNESITRAGSRGMGCIVFALARRDNLRGHTADLILHPGGISHYDMAPVLAVRAGTSEQYHRDIARPNEAA